MSSENLIEKVAVTYLNVNLIFQVNQKENSFEF